MQQVKESNITHPRDQILKFDGKEVRDEESLNDYNVTNGSILTLETKTETGFLNDAYVDLRDQYRETATPGRAFQVDKFLDTLFFHNSVFS